MTQAASQSERPRRRHARWLAAPFAALVLFAALGCWASRPAVVATPEFSSRQVRLDPQANAELAASRARVEAQAAEEHAALARAEQGESGPHDQLVSVKTTAPVNIAEPDKSATAEDSWPPVAPARDWRYIVLHHSGTEGGSIESIDAAHRQRTDESGQPWLGIGYHFVVGNGEEMTDGEIAPTFRWRQQLAGAHAGNTDYNAAGIGVCVIGDCDAAPPSPRQTESLKRLVSTLASRYQIPQSAIVPHSDLKPTNCPGRYFPLKEIAAAVVEPSGASQTHQPLAIAGLAFLLFSPPRDRH